MIPSCSPSSPTNRTSRARISSLIRKSLLIANHLQFFCLQRAKEYKKNKDGIPPVFIIQNEHNHTGKLTRTSSASCHEVRSGWLLLGISIIHSSALNVNNLICDFKCFIFIGRNRDFSVNHFLFIFTHFGIGFFRNHRFSCLCQTDGILR